MNTVYQMQFRCSIITDWTAYNHHHKYDVVDTLEKAKEIMRDAKEWHKQLDPKCAYEYRIIKISYDCEEIQI